MNLLYQKSQIASSFSKAAMTYDTASHLQKQTGGFLLEKLNEMILQPKNLLDVGSGTGYLTQKIANQYPTSKVIGIDISKGMILFSHQNHQHPNLSYLCADADHLPFPDHSIHVIFSNLMLQWSPNLSSTLNSFKRILKPGGYLFFSTLCDGTLFELKKAWESIDSDPHVHHFQTHQEISQCVLDTGYKIRHLQQKKKCFYYSRLLDLFFNLKLLGAHNLQKSRRKSLSGKKTFVQLTHAYDKLRQGLLQLPATYEVIYGIVEK